MCGPQVKTTFGFLVSFHCSLMVMVSAKLCKGCLVAASIEINGLLRYFWKSVKIFSSVSDFLFFKSAKHLIATTSQYCPITVAASFMCSTVVPFITAPSSVSQAQKSCPALKVITLKPRFSAAF